MKQTLARHAVRIAVVVTLALGALASRSLLAQASRTSEAQLKAAQQTEEVQGDLKGAIEQYKRLAEGNDKATAAKALLRMAGCYEKLGQNEAQKVYERILKDFASQAEAASEARTRLAALAARQSASPAGMSPHLAWTAPGHATFVNAVSPDGRYVVFENADEGDDLFLHDFMTGKDRRLTKADAKGEAGGDSAFSRDSRQLAYTWDTRPSGYELRVIDLEGSGIPQPQRLFADEALRYVQPHDWTPDAKWIAVVITREEGAGEQIALISTSGESLRVLKSVDPPVRIGRTYLSPDGKYLAFDAYSGTKASPKPRDIFVISMDGRQDIPAVVNPAHDVLVGWSPDGTRLLFTSDRTGSNGLFALPVRDGRPQGEPELIRPNVGPLNPLGLTTSGSLYFRDAKANPAGPNSAVKIGSFDFSTGQIQLPPTDLLLQYFAASNRSPDWSPDGSSLAYVVDRSSRAGDFSLAIRSLDNDQVQEIRPQLSHVEWLRWAPDGGSFVVSASDLKGVLGLWRVDRATAAVSAIASGAFSTTTSDWPQLDDRFHGSSPDARKIYYQRSIGGHQTPSQGAVLFERDLVSGVERELFRRPSPGPGVEGFPGFAMSLSADGRKLYYRRPLSDPSGSQAAFIERDLASGAEKELTRGNLGFLYLSPDGRSIATNTADVATKSQSILLVPVTGGQPRTLMQIALPQSVIDEVIRTKDAHGQNAISVLWAPDSRAFVFRHNFIRGKPDLWWVPVDGREAPKLVNPGVPDRLWDVRVHRDGRRFAIGAQPQQPTRRPDEIWVYENVLPKAGPKR